MFENTRKDLYKKISFFILKIKFSFTKEYRKGKENYNRYNKSNNYNMPYKGGQQCTVVYEIYLENKLNKILAKNKLKLIVHDLMGAKEYRLHRKNKLVKEFNRTPMYSGLEEAYWYIKNNYKG